MSQMSAYGSARDPMKPLQVAGEQQEADSRTVERFHRRSDVDSRKEAQHHTLGSAPNQSAPGNHIHDGTDSALILTGFTLTGSRGSATAMTPIIQALVKLGATDNTTA
jgi:hypothetical protein